jgi:hypothetical protein
VKQQKDRQEILDCLLRYTRGVDRHDKALMESAYHPDAYDDHGVSEGNPDDFCRDTIAFHYEYQVKHHHIITNHTVDIDGNTAHGETYWLYVSENRQGLPTISFGRYLDRFEKRSGKWAIAYRNCVIEKSGEFMDLNLPADLVEKVRANAPSRRDKQDVSYIRPLTRETVKKAVAAAR